MKKIIIYTLCIMTATAATAQDFVKHEFLLRGTAGVNSLQNDTKGFTNKASFGGGIGVGYNFFFNTQWGIGTGAEFSFYASKGSIPQLGMEYETLDKSTHENFTFRYDAKNFEEQQSATMLTIPLLITFQTGNKYTFYGSAGLRISIPVSATFEQTASEMKTLGRYPDFSYPIEDIPQAGFTTVQNYNSSGDINLKPSCMLSAEAGMKWKLANNWKLYTGLYIDYGLNNIQKESDKQVVQYQSDSPAVWGANSALNSPLTSSVRAISYGLRIGIAFGKSQSNPVK